MARPCDYTSEVAAAICSRLSAGQSLVRICADADMPHRDTVYAWLGRFPEFSDRYARAREEQADHYADEIIAIADGEGDTNDKRLRVDARKWIACKLKPRTYGERTSHEHSGPEGGAIPIGITVNYVGQGAAAGGVPVSPSEEG